MEAASSIGTSFAFDAIGTSWRIDIADTLSADEADVLRDRIFARIDAFDRAYSRFREDSLVTEMSRTAGTYVLPDDARPMFDLYHDLYTLTDGAFTPLIGDVLVQAGYDAAYSLRPGDVRQPAAWDDALEYRYPELVVRQPVTIDVGAAGKGHLIDIVAELLGNAGLRTFIIDAGGDMLHRDATGISVRVGLEHPSDASLAVGVADLGNASICCSSGNRRAWADYHHLIDPRTLASPRHIAATWTIAKTTMLADAMATCLFFVPAELLVARYAFEYLIMFADGTVARSDGFPAELFTV